LKNKVHVKTGDRVYVLTGKYKGKKGKVLKVYPSTGRVTVENVI
jgi:large subunit ribosomal protein L24